MCSYICISIHIHRKLFFWQKLNTDTDSQKKHRGVHIFNSQAWEATNKNVIWVSEILFMCFRNTEILFMCFRPTEGTNTHCRFEKKNLWIRFFVLCYNWWQNCKQNTARNLMNTVVNTNTSSVYFVFRSPLNNPAKSHLSLWGHSTVPPKDNEIARRLTSRLSALDMSMKGARGPSQDKMPVLSGISKKSRGRAQPDTYFSINTRPPPLRTQK